MKLGFRRMTLLMGVLALVAAGCGEDTPPADDGGTPAGEETVCATHDTNAGDLLAEICTNEEIRVSTDPGLPAPVGAEPGDGRVRGLRHRRRHRDRDRLGVDVAWETPDWEVLTAGGWNDRWDMSVGSMTPTNERQEVLDFTDPYAYVPAVVVVHEDSTVSDVTTDLDGKEIGFCASCTYEFFVDKSLSITGFEFDFVIDDAKGTGYDTDTTALQDLALGDGTRLDAVMTSAPTAQSFAEENPVKVVGDPVFGEPLAIAFDKESELEGASLQAAVDEIVAAMHADGTLSELSEKWFDGIDVTKV